MNQTANPFEQYRDATKPEWQRRKERIAEKRQTRTKAPDVLSPLERKLEEKGKLAKAYRAHVREREAEIMDGPHGQQVKGLRSFLRTMTLSSATALIKFVERCGWMKEMPTEDRQVILAMIGRAIARLRENEGYPPFDDALLDEDPDAFTQIKGIIAP